MKKLTAILTALTMTAASMLTVSAETTYALGDVDMDGVITGHDTGMVSRYLLESDYKLTDEQLSLADVDGDGEVTQADADKLYNEMQTVALGDIDYDYIKEYSTHTYSGKGVSVIDGGDILCAYGAEMVGNETNLTAVQKNLADLDLNGKIEISDAKIVVEMAAEIGAGMGDNISADCVYYYSCDKSSPAYAAYLLDLPFKS